MDCGTLTNQADGQVNITAGTTFGQTATYSCDAGYQLLENITRTRTCQADGMWSGNRATCISESNLLIMFNPKLIFG